MLCQNCQKKIANFHVTQIINQKKSEVHLCEECAQERGHIQVGEPIQLQSFFPDFMSLGGLSQFVNAVSAKAEGCEGCGLTFDEFQQSGKFGCGRCYFSFGDRIRPLLKRLHGNTEHVGKVPEVRPLELDKSDRVEELKEQLAKAVSNEEYEKAAELRDEIRKLENEKR